MESLRQDLAFGLRALRRRPGFAAAAVATLALGIGATTAIFDVMEQALVRPLPFPEPGRIVRVEERHAQGGRRLNLTGAAFAAIEPQRARSRRWRSSACTRSTSRARGRPRR